MHVGVVANKLKSLHGLQLEDLIAHLLSIADVVVSVHERFRSIIDLNIHPRLHFIQDFPSVQIDSYVLYGTDGLDTIDRLDGDVCYIPDPDLVSPFKQLPEELESLIGHFKTRFPRSSYFSLFGEDLGSSFNYLKTPIPRERVCPFDVCIVIDDSYGKLFGEFDFRNTNVLVIYIGSDNKACEDAVEGIWKLNPNVSLSTFQEPVSFSHACLARKIVYACEIVDPVSVCKLLRDVRFVASKIETTNEALARLPIFSIA